MSQEVFIMTLQRKKILSLISSCFLFVNSTSKPASSHFDLEDVAGYAYYASYGIPYGVIAAPVLGGLLAALIAAYESVKEKSINKHKFKIFKSAANKSFKIMKWLSLIPMGLCVAKLKSDKAPNGECICCYKKLLSAYLGMATTVGGLSWLGQKLTEDKEKTQKNDEPKIIKSNEKEITK